MDESPTKSSSMLILLVLIVVNINSNYDNEKKIGVKSCMHKKVCEKWSCDITFKEKIVCIDIVEVCEDMVKDKN